MKKAMMPRTELAEVLFSFRKAFYTAGVFSMFINVLGLVPSIYMLQVYDRVLASRSEFTLVVLTLLIIGLYALMAPGAGGAGASIWVTFVIGQVYLLARLAVKLQFIASQTALFQRSLAHASYVANPVPSWPESPTVEALTRS